MRSFPSCYCTRLPPQVPVITKLCVCAIPAKDGHNRCCKLRIACAAFLARSCDARREATTRSPGHKRRLRREYHCAIKPMTSYACRGRVESLQRKLAHRCQLHQFCIRGRHTGSAISPVLRLGAEPSGRICDRPDGAVFVAALEADPSYRRKSLSDADAKTDSLTAPLPALGEMSERLAHGNAEPDRTFRGVGHGTGSLKNTIMPSPLNLSSVPSNW